MAWPQAQTLALGYTHRLNNLIQSRGFKYHLHTEYRLPNFSCPEASWEYAPQLDTAQLTCCPHLAVPQQLT